MSNVVVLFSDEHNPFVSSLQGHQRVATPNMARLAAMGTVYGNAYCPSPLCLPSRSALMAGRRVHELQTYSNCNTNLNPDYPSYGRVLAAQGVHTVYVGKTDVYDAGANLGFSEMILPMDRGPQGDAFIRRKPLFIRPDAEKRADGYGPKEDAFRDDLQKVDAAIAWLRESSGHVDGPWVLMVNVTNPHFPQRVTPDLWAMYADCGDLPAHGLDCESAQHPYAHDLRDHFQTKKFTEEQTRGLRRGYLGCVTFVDQQLGRIIDTLDELGALSSTNIIYSSDHGEMLGKFGMWWKCTLYEDSVRVPLIAAGPDFPVANRIDTPVDLHDMQASLFYATGAERPESWVGTPLQTIRNGDSERTVFSEYHGHGTRAGAFMIRKGDWKLIHYIDAENQLFNLASDPDELSNVIADHPLRARELDADLRAICSPETEDARAFEFQHRQLARLGLL